MFGNETVCNSISSVNV